MNLTDVLVEVLHSLILEDRIRADALIRALDHDQIRLFYNRVNQIRDMTAQAITARGFVP